MEKVILNKKIGVLLTDTIYGIVGQALDKDVVERIYKVKKRNPKKPLIVLISSFDDLSNIFDIKLTNNQIKILNEFWPGKVSVILPCTKYEHLGRGTNSIAFRLPSNKSLIELVKKTGPIVATSVNKEGDVPAKNIEEAKKYFGNEMDFYIDSGEAKSETSLLINLNSDDV